MYTYNKVKNYILINNLSLLAVGGFYFLLNYLFKNECHAVSVIFTLIALFIYSIFMFATIKQDREIDIKMEFDGEGDGEGDPSFNISKYDSFLLIINGERFKLNKTEMHSFFRRDDSEV